MGLPPIDCGLERDASGVSEAAHQQLCIDDASEMYNAHRKEAYRAMRTRFCVEHIVCPEAGGGNKSACSRRSSSALPPSLPVSSIQKSTLPSSADSTSLLWRG